MIEIEALCKTYDSGFVALDALDLHIRRGEIFALLGPNGAGKTTLINIVCGIVQPSSGRVQVDGYDIHDDYRQARQRIGLVPQEMSVAGFESVLDTLNFSRGLFGKPAAPTVIETILRDLSLWDKRNERIMALSGGMKRRVLIAKALCHEPEVLFLDEPTAGVDVELRRDMWRMVRQLRERGVTIILTTHYIEEAEEMADRIGVINKGRIVMVEEKHRLMSQLGRKQLTLNLQSKLDCLPRLLSEYKLSLSDDGMTLTYQYEAQGQHDIPRLLRLLGEQKIEFRDLHTEESSLEDIFVSLVKEEQ